ncbi:hypothetical protein ACA910_010500 [Epithemia clementina (nom. ined.)]
MSRASRAAATAAAAAAAAAAVANGAAAADKNNKSGTLNDTLTSFLVRSLNRNDQELAALQDIHFRLHALKEELESRNAMLLLELGRGRVRLGTAATCAAGPPPLAAIQQQHHHSMDGGGSDHSHPTAGEDMAGGGGQEDEGYSDDYGGETTARTPFTPERLSSLAAQRSSPQQLHRSIMAVSQNAATTDSTLIVDCLVGTHEATIRLVDNLLRERQEQQLDDYDIDDFDHDDEGRKYHRHGKSKIPLYDVAVSYLLHFKLRRRLLNRLARRLLRVAHAMDTLKLQPEVPTLPSYGDLRLHVDPEAVEALEQVRLEQERILQQAEDYAQKQHKAEEEQNHRQQQHQKSKDKDNQRHLSSEATAAGKATPVITMPTPSEPVSNTTIQQQPKDEEQGSAPSYSPAAATSRVSPSQAEVVPSSGQPIVDIKEEEKDDPAMVAAAATLVQEEKLQSDLEGDQLTKGNDDGGGGDEQEETEETRRKEQRRNQLLASAIPRLEYQAFLEYKDVYEKQIPILLGPAPTTTKPAAASTPSSAPIGGGVNKPFSGASLGNQAANNEPQYTLNDPGGNNNANHNNDEEEWVENNNMKEDYERIPLGSSGIGATLPYRSVQTASEREAEFQRWKSSLLSKIPDQPRVFAEPFVYHYKKRMALAKKQQQEQQEARLREEQEKAAQHRLRMSSIKPSPGGGKTLKFMAELAKKNAHASQPKVTTTLVAAPGGGKALKRTPVIVASDDNDDDDDGGGKTSNDEAPNMDDVESSTARDQTATAKKTPDDTSKADVQGSEEEKGAEDAKDDSAKEDKTMKVDTAQPEGGAEGVEDAKPGEQQSKGTTEKESVTADSMEVGEAEATEAKDLDMAEKEKNDDDEQNQETKKQAASVESMEVDVAEENAEIEKKAEEDVDMKDAKPAYTAAKEADDTETNKRTDDAMEVENENVEAGKGELATTDDKGTDPAVTNDEEGTADSKRDKPTKEKSTDNEAIAEQTKEYDNSHESDTKDRGDESEAVSFDSATKGERPAKVQDDSKGGDCNTDVKVDASALEKEEKGQEDEQPTDTSSQEQRAKDGQTSPEEDASSDNDTEEGECKEEDAIKDAINENNKEEKKDTEGSETEKEPIDENAKLVKEDGAMDNKEGDKEKAQNQENRKDSPIETAHEKKKGDIESEADDSEEIDDEDKDETEDEKEEGECDTDASDDRDKTEKRKGGNDSDEDDEDENENDEKATHSKDEAKTEDNDDEEDKDNDSKMNDNEAFKTSTGDKTKQDESDGKADADDEDDKEDQANKEDGEDDGGSDCDDPVKNLKRPLLLVPTPSFYDQDLKRIKLIHAELMSTSIRDHARRRMEEVTLDYNNALRTSNAVFERRQSMQTQLQEMVTENHNYINQMNSDYQVKLSMARNNWLKRRREYERSKLDHLMPQRHNSQHFPEGTALTHMYMRQPDPTRQIVAQYVGGIVDAVTHISRGAVRNDKFHEEFRPPPKPDAGLSHKKRMEEQIRQEINNLTLQLRNSEEERQRAWKRMMKTKAEFDLPHHHMRTKIDLNLNNYQSLPLPPLRQSSTQNVPQEVARPASSTYASYVPQARRSITTTAPASAPASDDMDANESKYSAARVRQRIASDGTVAPVSVPKRTKDGLFQRPAGRTRKGMDWDAIRGIWVPSTTGGEQG